MRRTRGSAAECVADELLGDVAQRLDLVPREDVRQDDEPVAAIGGQIGGRQHDSS
jgi:hypothetical protein